MDRRAAQQLIRQIKRDGAHLAERFGLQYRVIEAERANVKRRYGVCFSDGTIRIRLRHAVSGRPLKYSSLVNTLCHELAHLRHFNHGLAFQRLYAEILAYARDAGLYRPGQKPAEPQLQKAVARATKPPTRRPRPKGPEQLTLFG